MITILHGGGGGLSGPPKVISNTCTTPNYDFSYQNDCGSSIRNGQCSPQEEGRDARQRGWAAVWTQFPEKESAEEKSLSL